MDGYDCFSDNPIMNNDDETRYLWTIRPNMSKEGIHTFSKVQHTHVSTDEDHPNIRQYVTAITHMVFDEPSMLYSDVEGDDDDDDDNADEDYDESSESDNDNNTNDEEDDISTPVNPLSSTTVNQRLSNFHLIIHHLEHF
ncbi:hypothetical protein M9H77_02756 [Catharanthus roseus]|uniref:Uncharacterized protein n=1 Tax=Catharanthus roseus TaxID=4058 RepID=A0ACC0C9Q3_CATRO|nr:hypothetical protein M9H77_02756 [Catharanthus roseus]